MVLRPETGTGPRSLVARALWSLRQRAERPTERIGLIDKGAHRLHVTAQCKRAQRMGLLEPARGVVERGKKMRRHTSEKGVAIGQG